MASARLPGRAIAALVCLALTALLARPSSAATRKTDPCKALNSAVLTGQYDLYSDLAFVRPSLVAPCASALGRWGSPLSGSFGYGPGYNYSQVLQDLENTILHFKNWYSLLHIAQKSPDPVNLPSAYDVVAELQKLKAVKWKSADDLYQAIALAIARLDDDHTASTYLSTIPSYFWLPLPLVGVVEDGVSVVRAAPVNLTDGYITNVSLGYPFNFDPTPLFGAKVLTISGVDAWTYIVDWAKSSPLGYHNLGQKLNAAFARISYYNNRQTFSIGEFASRAFNPGQDFIRIVLLTSGSKKPVTVNVPWIAAIAPDFFPFSGLTSSQKASLFSGPTTPQPQGRIPPEAEPSTPDILRRLPQVPTRFATQTETSYDIQQGQLISGPTDLWPVYKLSDGKTAVVVITTFLVNTFFGNPDYIFLKGTIAAFDLAAKSASQVIIDLTENPGGYIAWGKWLEQLLVGTWYFLKPPGRLSTSQRAFFLAETDLVKRLVEERISFYNYAQWWTLSERPFTKKTKKSFFYPIKELTFGPAGVPGNYSSPFKYPVKPVSTFGSRLPALKGKPFLLLSNGLCFSACDSFARTMSVNYKVPLVTIGSGLSPLGFSAAGGGFVIRNVDSYLTYNFAYEINGTDIPQPYNGMNLNMRIATAFQGPNDTIPIEFSFLKGDLQLNYTLDNVFDPTAVYLEAAKYFDK